MRWWLLAPLLVACTGQPVDTGPDTDPPDDTGDDTDTTLPVQWTDRTIETSTTLNDVYSGGQGATVVGQAGDSWAISGGQPDVLETGVDVDITGLWGVGGGSSLEMVAVGYAGTVLELVDGSWVRVEDPTLGTTNFEDIDGEPGDLTAVSVTGVYRSIDGDWIFESNGFNRSLRAVYVDGGGDAWAVGDNGTILRRVDDTWEQLSAPSGVDLRDVHGIADQVYIVGNRGTVLRWNGTDFDDLEPDTNVNLSGVWVADSGRAYIVGSNGTALLWDPDLPPPDDEDETDTEPGGFQLLPTGATSNLYAVRGSSETNIWAVGNRGALFRYTGPRDE